MAAYSLFYDSRHLQADCSSGTLRSAVEYGLPLPFYHVPQFNQFQWMSSNTAMLSTPTEWLYFHINLSQPLTVSLFFAAHGLWD